MFPKLISWLGMEEKKQNLAQQKHTFTNQKKCTTNIKYTQLECRPMPNVMVNLPNIGGAFC